jgi:hypothetical protein
MVRQQFVGALLTLLCAAHTARGDEAPRPSHNNTSSWPLPRYLPSAEGSLSSDGQYLCSISAMFANRYYDSSITASYDTSGYCMGTYGSYYCDRRSSFVYNSANRSMTLGGHCYSSPGAVYSSTPCSWNDIRVDYNHSGACNGASSAYIYYCPANYDSMNSFSGVTTIGPSGKTCYMTAAECISAGCSNTCIYDSLSTCGNSAGYFAYCPSTVQPYAYSSIGVSCWSSQSACNAAYKTTACLYDTYVFSGAGNTYNYYSPSSATVYTPVGDAGYWFTSDGYCHVSLAAATLQSGCTISVANDTLQATVCANMRSGFTYYCPFRSLSAYQESTAGLQCFQTAAGCAAYVPDKPSETCIYDSTVCLSSHPYYSTASSKVSTSSNSDVPFLRLCFLTAAAASYNADCSSPQRDESNSGACVWAKPFTYYCAATYVSSTATLGGYTSSTFSTAEVAAFKTAMAALLSVRLSVITVTAVTTATVPGRHLQATGVSVAFTVATANATSLVSAVQTATSSSAVTLAAMQRAGLSACTSASVAALTQGSVVTPVATTLLSTTVQNNTLGSNCGTCSSAIKSVASVAALLAAVAAALALAT